MSLEKLEARDAITLRDEAEAIAEAYIAFKSAFPGYLINVGDLNGRGLAEVCRRGDTEYQSFAGATPAEAVQEAMKYTFNFSIPRRMSIEKMHNCKRCKGRGWTITRTGGKRICDHQVIEAVS